MSVSLGIDTGGTFTDAVLFDDDLGLLAKAKAATTRHDLTVGIAEAVGAVLAAAAVEPTDIGLVSVSTTLATNALVEGRGGRVALVFIGFDEGDEQRGGLADAMGGDPIIRVRGGHDPQGEPIAPLDIEALGARVADVAPTVTAFAVSSRFATRNNAHETTARELIVATTGLPVTCGHELSAQLNGPRRALTSVLNARLIAMITSLVESARTIVARHGIEAPLMVVRGDGALMAASIAMQRPIETILSGPAASVVGGAFLTGLNDALIADIGGTTTDVAVVERGLPHLDSSGAKVGGMHTMVEAVAITTVGLGGDSEVIVVDTTVDAAVRLGPRRVVPLCVLAMTQPELVRDTLDRQLLSDMSSDHDARFVVPIAERGATVVGLDRYELSLLERIGHRVVAISHVVHSHADVSRLQRLVSRGLVTMSSFTPTDASHVLGDYLAFDRDAARAAAEVLARKRSAVGRPIAADAAAFARLVVATLERRSAELILDVALDIDSVDAGHAASNPLVARSLDGRSGIADVHVGIAVPLVGLGAGAPIYYPTVAEMVRAKGVIPIDADVANAIGAVVGRVRVHADVYVSQPARGQFRVHARDGVVDRFTLDEALSLAEQRAAAEAIERAIAAGAERPAVTCARSLNAAHIDGVEHFVDGTVTATATGRPRRAHAT